MEIDEGTKTRRPRSTKNQIKVRRQLCLDLAVRGQSTRRIAELLGTDYGISCSHQTVANDIQKALAETAQYSKGREDYRQIVLMRYERLVLANWGNAEDGNDGATKRVLSALEAIRKVAGLDLPPDPLPPSTNNVNVRVSWDDEVKTTSNDPYDEYD